MNRQEKTEIEKVFEFWDKKRETEKPYGLFGVDYIDWNLKHVILRDSRAGMRMH